MMPSDIAIRHAELGDLDQLSLLFVAPDDHHIKLRPDLFKPLLYPARAHDALRLMIMDTDFQAVLSLPRLPAA